LVQKVLTQKTATGLRGVGNDVTLCYFEDRNDNFDTTGVAVDDDAYDTGTFVDRDYEVRGFLDMAIVLVNIGLNGITYTVQEARKDFDSIDTDLVDADFTNVVGHTDVNIPASSESASYILIRLSADVTAVRLRARRTLAGQSSTLQGFIKGR
jgi:hypothetical protein